MLLLSTKKRLKSLFLKWSVKNETALFFCFFVPQKQVKLKIFFAVKHCYLGVFSVEISLRKCYPVIVFKLLYVTALQIQKANRLIEAKTAFQKINQSGKIRAVNFVIEKLAVEFQIVC